VPYQVFATTDGYIIIAVGNDTQFVAFSDILGQGQLVSDDRFRTNARRVRHREILVPLLAEVISTWDRDALLTACEEKGIPAGPVHSIDEVFETDQVKARDMVISMDYPLSGKGKIDLIGNPIKFSATPVEYHLPPPRCGEHTEEVLADWLGDTSAED
jgi:formyl-CoA transferase